VTEGIGPVQLRVQAGAIEFRAVDAPVDLRGDDGRPVATRTEEGMEVETRHALETHHQGVRRQESVGGVGGFAVAGRGDGIKIIDVQFVGELRAIGHALVRDGPAALQGSGDEGVDLASARSRRPGGSTPSWEARKLKGDELEGGARTRQAVAWQRWRCGRHGERGQGEIVARLGLVGTVPEIGKIVMVETLVSVTSRTSSTISSSTARINWMTA
jgi:hypothetical protein